MNGKILVTGTTGNIGFYVVEELLKRGKQVKAGVHNIEKAKKLFEGMEQTNLDITPFNFVDAETFDHALEGVDRVFLVRPPQLAKPKKDMKPFLEFLKKKANVHIVFVSLMGVEKNKVVPHRKIEDMILEWNIDHTFLRPGFFMQNLNTTHQEEITERNELFIPVGKAKTSFIDTRDIAAIAAVCLTEEGHVGKAYTLTGSEAIDYDEAAEILSDILERPIVYKNPGILEFRRTVINRGVEKGFANVMTMLYFITRLGTAEKTTDDVKKLLKREPITFRQYAMDHKEYWSKP